MGPAAGVIGVCNGVGLSIFCMNRFGQSEGLDDVTSDRGRRASARSITNQAQGSFDAVVGFQSVYGAVSGEVPSDVKHRQRAAAELRQHETLSRQSQQSCN